MPDTTFSGARRAADYTGLDWEIRRMNQLQIDAACNAAWEEAIAEAGRDGVPRHIIEAEKECFRTGFNMGASWAMKEMLTDAFQEYFAEEVSNAISKN